MDMTAKAAHAAATQAALDMLPTNVVKKDYDELINHITKAAGDGKFRVSFGNSHITWPGTYELPYYMWTFDEKRAHAVQAVKERQHLLRDSLISLLKEKGFVVESKTAGAISSITISWEKV